LTQADGEIVVSLNRIAKQSVRRLRTAVEVFKRLAETGALCGDMVPAGRSTIDLSETRVEESHFHFAFTSASIDDRAVLVLTHLLFTQHQWLDIERVRVLAGGVGQYVHVGRDADENTTYPSRAALPFALEDEEPESQAITLEVRFEEAPSDVVVKALDQSFKRWSDAIVRGGYALALIPPEESHVESYDEGFLVVEGAAERSYHKLTADDAAIDAALNMLAAVHARVQRIRLVRIT
jgi:hypothetical protein